MQEERIPYELPRTGTREVYRWVNGERVLIERQAVPQRYEHCHGEWIAINEIIYLCDGWE
jgi:hypothetical protein